LTYKENIDEWVYFFKNSAVKDGFHSSGIQKAKEKLDVLKMKEDERRKYENYLVNLTSELDIMETVE